MISFCSMPWVTGWGESGLVGQGAVTRIRRFPVRTLLGARPGLGTQPRYEASGNLLVDYVKRNWLTSGEWDYLFNNGPKLPWGSQIAVKKIKRTSVFHPVSLKKYNKKVLTEVWKDENTEENMKEIKEHEISNRLHRGLSVVPKIDGEIMFQLA